MEFKATQFGRVIVALAILHIALLNSACAPQQQKPSQPVVSDNNKPVARKPLDDWFVGEKRDSGIGSYQKLFSEFEGGEGYVGWRVWETSSSGYVACVAVKPSTGSLSPSIVSGLGVTGGGSAGFYMVFGRPPYRKADFGFYGQHYHRKFSIAEVDGRIVHGAIDTNTVLSWEGKKVKFEVTTGPYEHITVDQRKNAAVVDFTGVTKAYEQALACINSAVNQ